MCASFEVSGMADDVAQGYSGQRVLGLVSVLIIIAIGGVGFLVGVFSQSKDSIIGIWVFAFQPTPVSMAVYGMVVTTLVLLVSFSLIKIILLY